MGETKKVIREKGDSKKDGKFTAEFDIMRQGDTDKVEARIKMTNLSRDEAIKVAKKILVQVFVETSKGNLMEDVVETLSMTESISEEISEALGQKMAADIVDKIKADTDDKGE